VLLKKKIIIIILYPTRYVHIDSYALYLYGYTHFYTYTYADENFAKKSVELCAPVLNAIKRVLFQAIIMNVRDANGIVQSRISFVFRSWRMVRRFRQWINEYIYIYICISIRYNFFPVKRIQILFQKRVLIN